MSKLTQHEQKLDKVLRKNQPHISASVEDIIAENAGSDLPVESVDAVPEATLLIDLDEDDESDADTDTTTNLREALGEDDGDAEIEEMSQAIDDNVQAVESLYALATEARIQYSLGKDISGALCRTNKNIGKRILAHSAESRTLAVCLEAIEEETSELEEGGRHMVKGLAKRIGKWFHKKVSLGPRTLAKSEKISNKVKTKVLPKLQDSLKNEVERSRVEKLVKSSRNAGEGALPQSGTVESFSLALASMEYYKITDSKLSEDEAVGMFDLLINNTSQIGQLNKLFMGSLGRARLQVLLDECELVIDKATKAHGKNKETSAPTTPALEKFISESVNFTKAYDSVKTKAGRTKPKYTTQYDTYIEKQHTLQENFRAILENGLDAKSFKAIEAKFEKLGNAMSEDSEYDEDGDMSAYQGVYKAYININKVLQAIRKFVEYYEIVRKATLASAQLLAYAAKLSRRLISGETKFEQGIDKVKDKARDLGDRVKAGAKAAKSAFKRDKGDGDDIDADDLLD